MLIWLDTFLLNPDKARLILVDGEYITVVFTDNTSVNARNTESAREIARSISEMDNWWTHNNFMFNLNEVTYIRYDGDYSELPVIGFASGPSMSLDFSKKAVDLGSELRWLAKHDTDILQYGEIQ